jgi:UPF0288 family protein (methanogenesis marker protein 3)
LCFVGEFSLIAVHKFVGDCHKGLEAVDLLEEGMMISVEFIEEMV